MTAHRKVRVDFDPRRSFSVDVSGCTEDEKKEVQQAFFDVGIKWKAEGASFLCLYADLYTNSTRVGPYSDHLLYGTSPRTDSISHRQFLELVYEPDWEYKCVYEMLPAEQNPAPAVQGEPVGWYTEDHLDDKSATTYKAEVAQRWRDKGWPVWSLYAAPKPAEQQPVVTQLVESLEELIDLMEDIRHGEYTPDSFTTQPARDALATHRQQGGDL